MLVDELMKEIPAHLPEFPKLASGHDPYFFLGWDEVGGEVVLRYWFWSKTRNKKNKKRVFISEVKQLMRGSQTRGEIVRADFESNCPRTASDGGCGFAVIVSMLEHLGVGVRTVGGLANLDIQRIGELL